MQHSLKQLRDNWMILLAIVSLIVTWTTFNNRLVQAEGKIVELSEIAAQINDLNVRIAVIQTDINYIKLKIQ